MGIGFFVWFFAALSDTLHHIMPGGANMASTSMEPYDLYFRTNYKNFQPLPESAKPMEWHLRLPRAFVTIQRGSNGSVNLLSKSESSGELFVDLNTNLDATGESFVPSTTLVPELTRKNSIIFFLKNQEAVVSVAHFDSCIPETKQGDILKSRGLSYVSNTQCSDRLLRCSIICIQMDGTSNWA